MSRAAQCPRCGFPVSGAARFCATCGQPLQTPAAQPSSRTRSRILTISLVGCATLALLAVLSTVGYFGYRHWASIPGTQDSADSSGVGLVEADVDWTGGAITPPDLALHQKELSPHIDRLTAALQAGNVQAALSLSLPDVRDDLKSSLEGQPERMDRFARLLETRRLVAIEGDLAEFEVTEDGRKFFITLQHVGDNWLLHSF